MLEIPQDYKYLSHNRIYSKLIFLGFSIERIIPFIFIGSYTFMLKRLFTLATHKIYSLLIILIHGKGEATENFRFILFKKNQDYKILLDEKDRAFARCNDTLASLLNRVSKF